MRTPSLLQTVLGLIVVAALAAPGCGGDGDTSSSTSPATSSTTSGSASAGGTGGAGGEGGAGGAGGSTADNGIQATETVTAGEVSKSANYKMVFTFGQPTQNQGKTTSPGYRMQGGLVGANAGAP
jgi:hypothetical protein